MLNNSHDKIVLGTMETITGQVNQQVLKVQTNVTDEVCNGMKTMTDSVQGFKGDLRNDIHGIRQDLIAQVNEVVSKVSPLNILNQHITQSAQGVLNQLNAQIMSSEQRLMPAIGSLLRSDGRDIITVN